MGTITFRAEVTQTVDVGIFVDGLEKMIDKNFENLTNPEIIELLDAIHPDNLLGEHLVPTNPEADVDNFEVVRTECYELPNWNEIANRYKEKYELMEKIRRQDNKIRKQDDEIKRLKKVLSNDGADKV